MDKMALLMTLFYEACFCHCKGQNDLIVYLYGLTPRIQELLHNCILTSSYSCIIAHKNTLMQEYNNTKIHTRICALQKMPEYEHSEDTSPDKLHQPS